MIKNKFLLLTTLLVMLSLSACSFKTEKSESYTDEDGNTTTTTTTNDNGKITTDTTTSSADDEEYDDEGGNSEENTSIPDAVQSFADNFDTLSDSDTTYVTNIEDMGGGLYKIHITDPTMYYNVQMTDNEVTGASVTVSSTDGDIIQGCFGFFVKMLAADDVAEVVKGVMASDEGTYETDFANYTITTDNSSDTPFITLSLVRK